MLLQSREIVLGESIQIMWTKHRDHTRIRLGSSAVAKPSIMFGKSIDNPAINKELIIYADKVPE